MRFSLRGADGREHQVERQVLRRVKVRRPDGSVDRRLKVMVELELGPIQEQLEVSLDDRSASSEPVLIGRDFLHNNAVVDVSQQFIAK
ncbi:MAG: hypothetical protein KatS3mg124_1673 [Porticoccaceae bacterium]|nr:MAG: hypothetical protein KatS3mg124_1673 [Porticoccaceae bacterium]